MSKTHPFHQISIDIVGPLPKTDDGNQYMLTIIDKYSRFCMIQPMKNAITTTVINKIENWFAIFGPPEIILSDNGPQFLSSVYTHFIKTNDIQIKHTTAYHPEYNGQIERLHRWIKERLALLSHDLGLNFVVSNAYESDDWAKYLPMIQFKYNSTMNRMTTYSPMDSIRI